MHFERGDAKLTASVDTGPGCCIQDADAASAVSVKNKSKTDRGINMSKQIKGSSEKLVACAVALCMILGILSPTLICAQAFVGTDIEGHWAQAQIERWVDRGIVKGYEDSTFRPENPIKRCEFAALINRTFGFEQKAKVSFADIEGTEWFFDEAAKAVAAGYMLGDAEGTFRPEAPISRQEAALVLARLYDLKDPGKKHLFKDVDDIASWSYWAVMAVVDAGLMQGYPDGTFGPTGPIKRSETVTVLDRLVAELFTEKGVYGEVDAKKTITGNVHVLADGVEIHNTKITGDLLIAQSVGEGTVVLDDVTVDGKVKVQGGGNSSIILKNAKIGVLEVAKTGVRIVAVGTSEVGKAHVKAPAAIVQEEVEGVGIKTVVVEEIAGEGVVTLTGKFEEVKVVGRGVNVVVPTGQVESLTIEAPDAVVELGADASITDLIVDEPSEVKGSGKITNATINASGTVIEPKPENLTIPEEVTVIIAGEEVAGGEAPPSEPVAPPVGPVVPPEPEVVPVSDISVNPTTMTLTVGATGTITATVKPDNATNKNVTWSSSNTDVATVANGVVTAKAPGTATITATTEDGGKTATCMVTVAEVVTEPTTTEVEYTAEGEITEISDGVTYAEGKFTVPEGVTEFTFKDGGKEMKATYDEEAEEWTIAAVVTEPTTTEVEYTAEGEITEISDGVTYAEGKFTVPEGVTEFTFKDGEKEMKATFEDGTWSFAEVEEEVGSTYKFSYTVPEEIIEGEEVAIDVTFATDVKGDSGYDKVRFKFVATGPEGATVTFKATDTNNVEYIFTNEGVWGPETGFALPAEYTATTNWKLTFDKAGEYTITFKLVDLEDNEAVIAEGSETITVKAEPEEPSIPILTVTGPSEIIGAAAENFTVTFAVDHDKDLEYLEIDHNLGKYGSLPEGVDELPEFKLYPNAGNPWAPVGMDESEASNRKSIAEGWGLSATYVASSKTWTLTFGGDALIQIRALTAQYTNNEFQIYSLVKDTDGNQSGSMYDGSYVSTVVTLVSPPVVNTTQNKSYGTIKAAIADANAEDTIEVGAGTFSEELTINKSLTIFGVNADNDARTDEFLDEGTVVTGGIRITGGDVTLKGLTIKDKGIFALSSTGGLTVVNNRIEGISNAHQDAEDGSIIALDVNPATGPIVIQQNVFSDIGATNGTGTAIRIIGVADGITIADNIIRDVTKNGINLYSSCLANENAELMITGNEIINWDSDKDNNNVGGRAIRIEFDGAHSSATANITENKLIPPVYGSDQTPVDPQYVKLTMVNIVVDLTKNYWGSDSPDFKTILLVEGDKASECAYVPYYTDEAMTTLVEPEVTFTFTGLDNIVAGTVGFTINTKVTNNGAIAANISLRYKAVVTKDGSALANQVIRYPEATDNWPNQYHTFTTDSNGVAYFGPSSGFTLTQLPALLSAEGVTTPFQADFAAGSYSVTVSLLDISGGEVVLGSGTKEFTVIAPETVNFKTSAEQFLTGYTRPSVLYDGTNYHLWYRTYGTTPMKAYHRAANTIEDLKTASENELKLGEETWEGLDNFSIIKGADKYYMFSSNSDGTAINVYESTDGEKWGSTLTKVLDISNSAVGDWAKKKIDNPMVVYDGTEYKLYYQGKSDTTGYQIGLATSNSLTGSYTPVAEAVLKPGTGEEWDAGQLYQPWVVKDGDFYYMWYAAGSGPKAIGYAWSTDGINWTKTDEAITTATSGYYGKPTVVKSGGNWHMWFLHESDGSSNVMYVDTMTK